MIVRYFLFRNIVKMTRFLNEVFMEIKREHYLEMLNLIIEAKENEKQVTNKSK